MTSHAERIIRTHVTSSEMKFAKRNSLLDRNLAKKLLVCEDTLPVPLTRSMKKSGSTISATNDLTNVAVLKPTVIAAADEMIPLFVRKDLKDSDIYI
jgi:hypothetical protein